MKMDKVKLLNNLIAVKGIAHHDSFADVTYENHLHYNLYHEVVGIGEIGKLDVEYVDWYEVNNQVKVGDKVLIRWYDVEAAASKKDSDGFFIVDYSGIVAIERDGELIPVNDHILYEAEEDGHYPIGRVVSVASDVKHYMSYEGKLFLPTKINIGEWIQVERFTGREVEFKHYQKNDKKLFAVQAKDIIIISKSRIHGELQ
jgi:co-chaperonin GroES (HSP10)